MSGVISFKGGDFWGAGGFVFHGYLESVRAEVGNDERLGYLIEQGMALNGLHLSSLDPDEIDRLAPVLLRVADEVVAGTRPVSVEGRGTLGEEHQAQFRRAVGELRVLLHEHYGPGETRVESNRALEMVYRKRPEVLLSLQEALLGEVTPNLRSVRVKFDRDRIHFVAFYDGPIGEAEQKSMALVESRVRIDFPPPQQVTHEVTRMDVPKRLPQMGREVYARKEPPPG